MPKEKPGHPQISVSGVVQWMGGTYPPSQSLLSLNLPSCLSMLYLCPIIRELKPTHSLQKKHERRSEKWQVFFYYSPPNKRMFCCSSRRLLRHSWPGPGIRITPQQEQGFEWENLSLLVAEPPTISFQPLSAGPVDATSATIITSMCKRTAAGWRRLG